VILPDDIIGEPDCECKAALQSSRSFVGSNLIAQDMDELSVADNL
jgi:hypothetical protein